MDISNECLGRDNEERDEQHITAETEDNIYLQKKDANDAMVFRIQPFVPDGGWGWVVVCSSFLIHVIADGITYSSFGILLIEFTKEFGEGRGTISLIPSILVGITLCVGPLSSSLVTLYGCRSVTITGSIIGGLGLMSSCFAPNVTSLFISAGMITGFGFGLIYLPAIVSVSMYFEKKRAFATGIAVCGSGFGTFIMPPLTQIMIEQFKWRGTMVGLGCLTLICVVFGSLIKPLPSTEVENSDANSLIIAIPTSRNDEKLGNDERVSRCSKKDILSNSTNDMIRPLAYHRSTEPTEFDDNNLEERRTTEYHTPPPVDGAFFSHPTLVSNNLSCQGISEISKHQSQCLQKLSQPQRYIFRSCDKLQHDNPRKRMIQDGHNGNGHATRSNYTCNNLNTRNGGDVMMRKDILYCASLLNIPEYRNNPIQYSSDASLRSHRFQKGACLESCYFAGNRSSINDNLQNRHLERLDEVESNDGELKGDCSISSRRPPAIQIDEMPVDESRHCFQLMCRDVFASTWENMMNVELLQDRIFLIFSISNFFTSIGFYVPYIYTVDRAKMMGIPYDDAIMLLSVIGIANTGGRIVLGYISDRSWLNKLNLYIISLVLCGLCICVSSLSEVYAFQAVCCAIFGVTSGAYVGLTSVVLVDLLGIDKLTNAFGLLLLFQGVSSFLGPPLIGAMYDHLGSYDAGFYFAGTMICISGLMLLGIPMVPTTLQKNEE